MEKKWKSLARLKMAMVSALLLLAGFFVTGSGNVMATEEVQVIEISDWGENANYFWHNCVKLRGDENKDSILTLEEVEKLEKLTCAANLEKIPSGIGMLKSLKELSLSHNSDLKQIPKEIGNLKELEELYLGQTSITSLPDEIGNLRNLKKLNLYGASMLDKTITELPDTIVNLQNLVELDLYGSGISSLEKIVKLTSLQKLDLTYGEIEIIPPGISNLKNLTELNLEFNNIKSLPKEIGNLKKLISLNLGKNYVLEVIPVEITELTELKFLDLGHNNISFIPGEIANLDKLLDLYLHDNKITSFPSGLADVFSLENTRKEGLKRLYINDNNANCIPEGLNVNSHEIDNPHVSIYRYQGPKEICKAYPKIKLNTSSQTRTATNGWNAVTPTNDTVYYVGEKPELEGSFEYVEVSKLSEVFSSIKGSYLVRGQDKYGAIVTYDSIVPEFFNTMKYIIPGRGYLIKVNQDETWQLESEPFSGTLEMSLREGWNLIGNPFQDELSKEEFFGSNAHLVKTIQNPITKAEVSSISSEQAVWVYAKEAFVLEVSPENKSIEAQTETTLAPKSTSEPTNSETIDKDEEQVKPVKNSIKREIKQKKEKGKTTRTRRKRR